jgi:hypothetical protein
MAGLVKNLKTCLGEESLKNVEVYIMVLDDAEETSIKGNRVSSTDTSPMGAFANSLLRCMESANHIA